MSSGADVPSGGSRALPVWRKLLYAFATTAMALALLEAASWLGGRVQFPPDPLLTDSRDAWLARRAYDPLLFWRMQPGLVNEYGPLTNSLGLRGPEIPPDDGDEFRILSLGESTTFSARMPYASTYSALLEQGLGRVDGRTVRVINAGVPGYSLFQGYVYLANRGVELEPDAVLLYFGYNDFLPVAFREDRDRMAGSTASGMTDAELFARRRSPLGRLEHALLRGSNAYRLLGSLASDLGGPASDASPKMDDERVRVPEPERRETLRRFRELCESRGLRLAVVVPWYRSFEDHAPLLREFAAASGVPLVDLPVRLAHLEASRPGYFRDLVHPTEEGHRLIAREILDVLQASWDVDGAPGPGDAPPAQGAGR